MELESIYRAAELLAVIIGVAGILYRLGRMTERFEQIGTQQAKEITELKDTVKDLVKSNIRMERIEERQLMEGQRIDAMENTFRRLTERGMLGWPTQD